MEVRWDVGRRVDAARRRLHVPQGPGARSARSARSSRVRFEARHAEPRHLVRAEDGPNLKAFEKENVILKEMKIS